MVEIPFLRARTWLAMRFRELKSYSADLAFSKNVDRTHVLIFAQGRSGTTLLESLLTSTGHFIGLGEPLHTHTRQVWLPIRYLRGLGRRSRSNLVVHVKGSQLTRERKRPIQPSTLLSTLHDDGWKIIYVLRHSLADQVLSECLALARGAYHKTDDFTDSTKLSIDPDEFVHRYERRRRFYEQDQMALKNLQFQSVIYEQDLVDPQKHQATIDLLCRRFGLQARQVQTKLRRLSSDHPSERLSNYDEVLGALRARGYEWSSGPAEKPRREGQTVAARTR